MSEIVIKAQNVGKKFCKSLYRSMLYGISDVASTVIGTELKTEVLRKDEFWAVDDVSFELKKGEALGLIGPNGSGKTTLLRILNGIFMPDKGRIEIKGKVGALIQVGAGFHQMLTGRENIYVNGAILGMSKKEIDKKFDSIINFAEIGDFIDAPVKFYSSGMYVRLGFAIAIHCEPDILLIDEILAVGDLAFRVRCFSKLAEITKNCAVIIVSHNMSAISRIASKCMVLHKGKVSYCGSPDQSIQKYQALLDKEKIEDRDCLLNSGAQVENIILLNENNEETDSFHYADSFAIAFDTKVLPSYKTFLVSVTFHSQELGVVAQSDSKHNGVVIENNGMRMRIRVKIPKLLLNPGRYAINLTLFDDRHQKYLFWDNRAKCFSVNGSFVGLGNIQFQGEWEISDRSTEE